MWEFQFPPMFAGEIRPWDISPNNSYMEWNLNKSICTNSKRLGGIASSIISKTKLGSI